MGIIFGDAGKLCSIYLQVKKKVTDIDLGGPLDAWAPERGGCLTGTGSEDAQFSDGNVDGTCNGLENAAWAYDGVQYYMFSSSAF